jgi:hypothetical protein
LSDAEALATCIAGVPGEMPGVGAAARIHDSWLDGGGDATVVRYERLVADPVAELCAISTYAGLGLTRGFAAAVSDRHRFERLTAGRRIWRAGRRPGESDPRSHFRKGVVGDWRAHFTPEHVALFKAHGGADLIRLGYEQDDRWSAAPATEAEA